MQRKHRLLATLSGAAMALSLLPATAAVAQRQAASAAEPKRDLSRPFSAALQPAFAAIKSGDYAAANAAVTAARAQAKTPDERYMVERVAFDIAQGTNDDAARDRAIAAVLASGVAPQREAALFNARLASQAFNAQNSQDAIRYAQAAKAAGSTNSDLDLVLAESYGRLKDYPKALTGIQSIIAAGEATGTKPDKQLYARAAQFAYQSGDPVLLNEALRAWVGAYPDSETWHDALVSSAAAGKYGEPVQLDYFRLLRAADALTQEQDWRAYAELASLANLNGEVIAVVDAGTASGVLNAGSTADLYQSAKAKSAEDRASLVQEARTASAKTQAKPVAAAADALAGYGDYAQAVTLYRIAADKPGADLDEINLRMGIAQAMAGQYADAKASFAKVGGDRQELARYWTLWVDSRGGA